MKVARPMLQVALDEMNLPRALQIAQEAVTGGADWIEAGTPLIKSEGMNAVRELRKAFPRNEIVADMKTMDTGAYETEMACKAGASVVMILAAADDGTIRDAVKAARKYGAKLSVDMLGVQDWVARAKECEALGVDLINVHVGVDQQMAGQNPLARLKAVAKAVRVPLQVAGGLNSETVPKVVSAGASVVIVGGAIIKAQNVTDATRRIKKTMTSMKALPTELYKRYSQDDLAQAFKKVSSSNVSDAMHRKGAMFGLNPIQQGGKAVGRAVTVHTVNGDWAKPVEAIDVAGPGEVLVINVDGGNIAVWGELASWSAKVRGIEGIVVDGAVRDVDDIRAMGLPIWTRHIVPNAGEPKGFGEIGSEIRCGGQTVRNGDWIVADDMGVVVVPQEEAQELANRALDVKEHENRLREEIQRGSSLSKVTRLRKWEKVVG
jgi:3-hexulose-6-phosphate synthase / 6-phospho-3-hexuloisomerase